MIGVIIQRKRKEAGLTQAQLAELLGVTAPAVNRWEKDLSFPDATLLAPLARCLKTDLNELFSFYDSLSEKERQLIIDTANRMLLLEDQEAALDYIDEAIRNNLSDGLLHLGMANALLGAHTLRKAEKPMIYLDRIASLYERAMALLPEQATDISYSLMTIYAEMGKRDKAEEAWRKLPDKSYDKKWAHAEMLYQLKAYDDALPEIRKLLLDRIISLSQNLIFFGDTLYLSGDKKSAELAEELDAGLRQLFGLWSGIDVINRMTSAIETQPAEAKEVKLSDLISGDFSQAKISSCPLFENVTLGGAPSNDRSTGDLIADILSALQKLPANTK